MKVEPWRSAGIGLILGGIAGWVVARWSRADPTDALVAAGGGATEAGERALPDATPARREEPAGTRPAAVDPPATVSPRSADDLITPALLDHARQGIRGGWARRRQDDVPADVMEAALKRFVDEVRGVPWRIGDELATRRNQAEAALEDARTGGAFGLLDKLDKGGGPLPELVRDRAALEQLMPRQAPETFTLGESHVRNPDRALRAGVTLRFPPGVFEMHSLMREANPFPSDVTLAGAGMNETLFLVGGLSAQGQLRNFGIRDCTIYHDCEVLNLHDPATVSLERVRVIGFDCGAGGSSALDAGRAVLLARDCRFEGGYGRHPGNAKLFDVRTSALVARFDQCTFSLMNLGGFRADATVLFAGCTMRDIFASNPDRTAWDRSPLFQACDIGFFTGDRNAIPRKDLNALFPDWERRVTR